MSGTEATILIEHAIFLHTTLLRLTDSTGATFLCVYKNAVNDGGCSRLAHILKLLKSASRVSNGTTKEN